ncbi:hypothetical protein D3C80_1918290 [compost metagenome]
MNSQIRTSRNNCCPGTIALLPFRLRPYWRITSSRLFRNQQKLPEILRNWLRKNRTSGSRISRRGRILLMRSQLKLLYSMKWNPMIFNTRRILVSLLQVKSALMMDWNKLM